MDWSSYWQGILSGWLIIALVVLLIIVLNAIVDKLHIIMSEIDLYRTMKIDEEYQKRKKTSDTIE